MNEIIIFDRALTKEERITLETYLYIPFCDEWDIERPQERLI